MDKKYKITTTNLLYLFLMLAIPVVCVSGVSVYPAKIRPYLVLLMGFVCAFITVFIKKRLVLNSISVPSLLFCGMALVSVLYSMDTATSAEFGAFFLACVFLLFADLPEGLFERVIFIFKIFCVIIAISIILSVFIDDFMLRYFSFFINPYNSESVVRSVFEEINYCHSYSGLAGERAEAAYIMNVGIATVSAKYFSGQKLKAGDFVMLVLFVVALVFTNKRMLFVIPFIALAVMMLLGNIKKKGIKFVAIALIAVGAFFILAAYIPQFGNIYNRFMLTDSDDALNGRSELWVYSLDMFKTSPIIGHGYGSYNEYAYNNGLLVNGERFNYFGHNCYYELLGELGIVGAVIAAFAFTLPLVYTIVMLYKRIGTAEQKRLLMFSLYIQVMFFVYCFSGNPLYNSDQIVMWFFAIAITLHVKQEYDFKLIDKTRGRLVRAQADRLKRRSV